MFPRTKELKELEFANIVNALMGECYPYGSESFDEDRYNNLIEKIYVIQTLIDEIIDAGKLYNRHEHSILRISNKANQYLTDLRDYLCDIEYLPPREDIE